MNRIRRNILYRTRFPGHKIETPMCCRTPPSSRLRRVLRGPILGGLKTAHHVGVTSFLKPRASLHTLSSLRRGS